MSAALAPPLTAETVRGAVSFQPLGEPEGNVTAGRGSLDGIAVHVALVENRTASGSIGRKESACLGKLFDTVARERAPLVLFLDSAGAKISEGLPALGAFRSLYRSGLAAARSGGPMAAILGRNCFGGASMLAHLAARRLFAPGTMLAMSGPSILAAAAGADALDEMFRAMADAAISSTARAKASSANRAWDGSFDLQAWLRESLAPHDGSPRDFAARHRELGERLDPAARLRPFEPLRRRDLDKLFPEGCEARDCDGLVVGSVRREGAGEPLLGLMSRTPVGAARAWRFADAAREVAGTSARRLNVVLDCETHAARLEDERIVLSEFIAGMGLALAEVAASGIAVELTILGRAGGGVYVALAGPAGRVLVEFGARVQVLPGAAVAAILGVDDSQAPSAADCVAAGVADAEIRLGIVD